MFEDGEREPDEHLKLQFEAVSQFDAAVKSDEIASRLTGLSCPILGVSWTLPEPDRKVARQVIAFLEDGDRDPSPLRRVRPLDPRLPDPGTAGYWTATRPFRPRVGP